MPLGVVTGMAAAHPARSLIVVAGLAEAVAGAISMGGCSPPPDPALQSSSTLPGSPLRAARSASSRHREADGLALVLEREALARESKERVGAAARAQSERLLRAMAETVALFTRDAGEAALVDPFVVAATHLGA